MGSRIFLKISHLSTKLLMKMAGLVLCYLRTVTGAAKRLDILSWFQKGNMWYMLCTCNMPIKCSKERNLLTKHKKMAIVPIWIQSFLTGLLIMAWAWFRLKGIPFPNYFSPKIKYNQFFSNVHRLSPTFPQKCRINIIVLHSTNR